MTKTELQFPELRVLVAEATYNMRTTMKHVLNGMGIRKIRTVQDAVTAIDFLALNRVDIAFIDMALEDWPGVNVLNAIRRGADNPNRNLPVVMSVFEPKRSDLMEALQLGATTFLSKPLNAKTVHARVIASLDQNIPFIDTQAYVGPERRKKRMPLPEGVSSDRRKQNAGAASGKSKHPMEEVLVQIPNTEASKKRAEEQKRRSAAVLMREMEANKIIGGEPGRAYNERRIKVTELVPGMQLARSCELKGGAVLIGPGIKLTTNAIRRLYDCVAAQKISETVYVIVPDEE